jgi:plastocyanin
MRNLRGGKARIGVGAAVVAAAVVGAALAGIVAHAGTRATRVTVTEREYHLTLSKRTLAPGAVTFVIVNRGKLRHSLSVQGPGVKKRLRGTIAPGKHRMLSLKLTSGTYTIWCPVAGHAAKGMKTTIKVTAPGATTSTGGGGGWG